MTFANLLAAASKPSKGKSGASPSIRRQLWLEAGAEALRERFASVGYKVPANVRVSIGWPRGSHGKGRAIGQCWGDTASSDKHHEIFVSPELGEKAASVQILGVLAHEMAHATVGVPAGHKAPFKKCAVAIGLEGKMTATTEGADFIAWAKGIVKTLGDYPAGRLSLAGRKKQTTRLLKCECEDCGYNVRVTRKWVESDGAPICPTDKVAMKCDAVDGEEEEDE
jgi:hypothetical protein